MINQLFFAAGVYANPGPNLNNLGGAKSLNVNNMEDCKTISNTKKDGAQEALDDLKSSSRLNSATIYYLLRKYVNAKIVIPTPKELCEYAEEAIYDAKALKSTLARLKDDQSVRYILLLNVAAETGNFAHTATHNNHWVALFVDKQGTKALVFYVDPRGISITTEIRNTINGVLGDAGTLIDVQAKIQHTDKKDAFTTNDYCGDFLVYMLKKIASECTKGPLTNDNINFNELFKKDIKAGMDEDLSKVLGDTIRKESVNDISSEIGSVFMDSHNKEIYEEVIEKEKDMEKEDLSFNSGDNHEDDSDMNNMNKDTLLLLSGRVGNNQKYIKEAGNTYTFLEPNARNINLLLSLDVTSVKDAGKLSTILCKLHTVTADSCSKISTHVWLEWPKVFEAQGDHVLSTTDKPSVYNDCSRVFIYTHSTEDAGIMGNNKNPPTCWWPPELKKALELLCGNTPPDYIYILGCGSTYAARCLKSLYNPSKKPEVYGFQGIVEDEGIDTVFSVRNMIKDGVDNIVGGYGEILLDGDDPLRGILENIIEVDYEAPMSMPKCLQTDFPGDDYNCGY